jgi:predicted negative regulator of RcsB-dependent stress response
MPMADDQKPIEVKPLALSSGATPTGLAHFIIQHRIFFISFVVAIIVGILGWGLYRQQLTEKEGELRALNAQFEQKELKDLKTKQMTPSAFLAAFQSLAEKNGRFEGLLPVLLESADTLLDLNADQEATQLLKIGESKFSKSNPYANYFISIRLAAAYENTGQIPLAIEILEQLNLQKIKLLESKVSLDLGRLYMLQNNKEKAQTYFRQVIENFAVAELARIARIYLEKMNQNEAQPVQK